MRGWESHERRQLRRYMWSLPSTIAGAFDSNGSSDCYFIKDHSKISVGDCALFKSAKDFPPFVGIIRCWTSEKESNIKLRVNWLYRPSEAKLLRGVALEAAPNEIFYSFHSDEIPASSLLHPCKVAFLPRGFDLPPGISSFVCRRVYDITNKCLWWLTDQDYIDVRQEEVDQLLHKTYIEMHASVEQQQGSRSPKPVNGSAASPLKHSPDSVQNSSSNHFSHRKGKKREQGDQSLDVSKRDRSSKADEGDSGQLKSESTSNFEIAKFSEKGGLLDLEAVARLVRLMQPEKPEKKIDLTVRCMLAGVIAATDKFDCLSQFVQLRGLHILNEWLQEVHKGKIRDSGNMKSNDKSVDDFLLVLLRALDKLPVNLNALQMCNIGKSVNHLRYHKNPEIQKKARSLVDMWKKRVEVEMNIGEVDRSQHESSHGGSRHHSGSDAAIKSPITHYSTLKPTSVKHVPGEFNSKSTSAHSGSARSTMSPTSTTDSCKDGQSRLTVNGGSCDPQIVAKEEKSSSSSQSHTNSQCSGEQAKHTVPCGKEDTRRSTAGSKSLNKTVDTTKHRKSANNPSSGGNRETVSTKSSSMAKNSTVEKLSHSVVDASVQESNNHKIIVKIASRGRGPAQSVGGSLEDPSCRNSSDSSPAHSEKHDQSDAFLRGNKYESQQFCKVDGSVSVHQKSNETKRSFNVSKIGCLSSRTEMKTRKAPDSSFSPMNALIESCAKISEANVSMSAGDDVGMNLLASVAAREISKSSIVSPPVSPHRSSKMIENSSSNCVADHIADVMQHNQSSEVADTDNHIADVLKVDGDISRQCTSEPENLHPSVEGYLKNNGTSVENMGAVSTPVPVSCTLTRTASDSVSETAKEKPVATEESQNELSFASTKVGSSLDEQDNITSASVKDEYEIIVQKDDLTNDDNKKKNVIQLPKSDVLEQSAPVALQCDPTNANGKLVMASGITSRHLAAEMSNEVKSEQTDAVAITGHDSTSVVGKMMLIKEISTSASEKRVEAEGYCADVDQNEYCDCKTSENKEPGASALQTNCDVASRKEDENLRVEVSELPAAEEESKEKSRPETENVTVEPDIGGTAVDSKLGFDLNEGFDVDEGKNSELVNTAAGVVAAEQAPVSVSCGLPASVTVASAAKGPFVPPDDLLWNRRELGWKGSAATSAFRPAEPRKYMEGPSKASLSDTSACRPARCPLDIDLNVADESFSQDFSVRNSPASELTSTASLRSSGGLELDLNKVEEAPEMVHVGRHMASNIQRVEVSTLQVNPSTSSVFSSCAPSGKRYFDLNDGPEMEDVSVEQIPSSQPYRGPIPFQQPLGSRVNSSDIGNCLPWYPPGTSYSLSVTPSALPDGEAFSIVGIGGGHQRVMGGPPSALSYNPDAYRGSVLSSSPALPFHSSPFQYPVLPFGTSFPLPTSALTGGSSGYMDLATGGRISAIPSQLVGNAAAVSFQYPHAYVVSRSLPDVVSTGVVESSHKWGKQGLDLNSGPGALDVEGRDESLPAVSRQVSTTSSQSLADEQARMYSMGGGHLKRKEPEGGWNIDKFNFKQSSWR